MQALLLALVLACAHTNSADIGRANVSPVEKVIELMERLQTSVSEEGKNEARQYDQFACFCKDQADAKTKAIEANKELEGKLGATIKELAAEIALLETEVPALAKKIDQLSQETKELVAEREKVHADYVKAELDVSEAIDACAAAIDVLKDAKAKIKAGGGKVDLMQVLKAAQGRFARAAVGERSQAVLALLSAREVPASPEKALKFEFQSNDIVETIKDLMRQFKEDKKELDDTEFESKAAFDKKKLGLDHEKELAEQDKEQKEQLILTKTEEEQKAKQDYEATVAALKADEGFLEELTTTCEKKAEAWDERSKTRAAELTAIAEATEVLKTVALKNYKPAKLAALQRKSSDARASGGALSLLQTSEDQRRRAVVRRVQAELLEAAARLRSPSLASVATAVGAVNDKFAKVIGLIEELIAKLEKQATEEAELKTLCDDHQKEIEETEAKAKKDIKDAEIAIEKDEAEKKTAQNAVQELTEQIIGLKKALLKAKELRAKEEAANSKAVADAKAGLDAVKLAQTILKDFYGDFLQVGAAAPSPAADSEGNTVADLAPKTFGGEYKGKKAESGGVVAMLDVILSDFERTLSETEAAEAAAVAEFEEFQKHCEEDEEAKTKEREEKKTKIAELTDALMEHRDTVKTSKIALKHNNDEREKLKAMCVFGQDTYEVRVARREQEIEALREAYKMLDAYQP